MKKRISGLMLTLAMAVSLLAGCGSGAGGSGDGLKIAIVSSPSGVDDGSFNQNNYEGIQAFIASNPDATVTPVKEESGEVAAALKAVADIVADYDVIVCCGFQFAGIGSLAGENPEEGGLPRAVPAQDSYPLPGVHLKGQTVQHRLPDLVFLYQVFYGDLDHGYLPFSQKM